MTLKIDRYMTDALNKQAEISHWDFKISVGKPDKLKMDIKQIIRDQFGELFLNDANYIVLSKVECEEAKKDRTCKKFAELLETVFLTDIEKSEVKVCKLGGVSEDEDAEIEDPEEEPEQDMPKGGKYLLIVKVTTK